MDLILSPKDNVNKLALTGVETFALEGCTLLVVFADGRTRNFPLIHLWYYESRVSASRSRPQPADSIMAAHLADGGSPAS
jgi:hypothetical protein